MADGEIDGGEMLYKGGFTDACYAHDSYYDVIWTCILLVSAPGCSVWLSHPTGGLLVDSLVMFTATVTV